jgi:hypothetical protein
VQSHEREAHRDALMQSFVRLANASARLHSQEKEPVFRSACE